jgi:hypothetical protein
VVQKFGWVCRWSKPVALFSFDQAEQYTTLLNTPNIKLCYPTSEKDIFLDKQRNKETVEKAQNPVLKKLIILVLGNLDKDNRWLTRHSYSVCVLTRSTGRGQTRGDIVSDWGYMRCRANRNLTLC